AEARREIVWRRSFGLAEVIEAGYAHDGHILFLARDRRRGHLETGGPLLPAHFFHIGKADRARFGLGRDSRAAFGALHYIRFLSARYLVEAKFLDLMLELTRSTFQPSAAFLRT